MVEVLVESDIGPGFRCAHPGYAGLARAVGAAPPFLHARVGRSLARHRQIFAAQPNVDGFAGPGFPGRHHIIEGVAGIVTLDLFAARRRDVVALNRHMLSIRAAPVDGVGEG